MASKLPLLLTVIGASVQQARASSIQVEADQHELCSFWALSGECKKNPTFMLVQCATSCSDGKIAQTDEIQADTHVECTTWANGGECEKNPQFMLSGCAMACHRRAEGDTTPSDSIIAMRLHLCVVLHTLRGLVVNPLPMSHSIIAFAIGF